MMDMLTAKEIQEMLQVDRSTVYRMAEAGQLPAIKVGKQWRFPSDQIESWFQTQMTVTVPGMTGVRNASHYPADVVEQTLEDLLPTVCVQIIQDAFADLLGVMIVVTDMEGRPVTEPSNTCGLFETIHDLPEAIQKCTQSWHDLAQAIDLTPRFSQSHLGLLCARSMIRVGRELKGMVIAGCIQPERWPPAAVEIEALAADFGAAPEAMFEKVDDIHQLDDGQKQAVLAFLPRIANVIAHIVNERKSLVGRLEAIASLTQLKEF